MMSRNMNATDGRNVTETDFDSVLKTRSYQSVSYAPMTRSFRRESLWKQKSTEEKEEITEEHLNFSKVCEIKSGNKITFKRKRYPCPSLISCLHKHDMEQVGSKAQSEIPVNKGSSTRSLSIEDLFDESTLRRSSFEDEHSSEMENMELCKTFLMEQCEVNSICDISQVIQERYCRTEFEKIADMPCNQILLWKSKESGNDLKIMRVEGKCESHGKPTVKYRDVILEILISRSLTRLQMDSNICTVGFMNLAYCWYAHGPCISELTNTWDRCTSAHENPTSNRSEISNDFKYVIFEEKQIDYKLSSYKLHNAYQALALFQQVAFSIAVAEKHFQFEHRNLLSKNIGLRHTNSVMVTYTLNSRQYSIPTAGLEVVIMNFSCARMTFLDQSGKGIPIYKNLDLTVNYLIKEFSKNGDYTYHVYCRMKNYLKNDWKCFLPHTNILWLEYLLGTLLTKMDYRCPENELHFKGLKCLQYIQKKLRRYESAEELVESLENICNFP